LRSFFRLPDVVVLKKTSILDNPLLRQTRCPVPWQAEAFPRAVPNAKPSLFAQKRGRLINVSFISFVFANRF
jgi:hypothetical protein